MDMGTIGGALTSLRAASDIVRGLVASNTAVEVNKVKLDLQNALLSAYSEAVASAEAHQALVDEIRNLKAQLASMEDFAAELKRYRLDVPWPGGAVYAMDQAMSNGEPAHYLCTTCVQSRKKSILQTTSNQLGFTCFTCPVCRTSATTRYKGSVTAHYAAEPSQ